MTQTSESYKSIINQKINILILIWPENYYKKKLLQIDNSFKKRSNIDQKLMNQVVQIVHWSDIKQPNC